MPAKAKVAGMARSYSLFLAPTVGSETYIFYQTVS